MVQQTIGTHGTAAADGRQDRTGQSAAVWSSCQTVPENGQRQAELPICAGLAGIEGHHQHDPTRLTHQLADSETHQRQL